MRRTAIEKLVLDDGLTISAAVKTAALEQIGRLVDALNAEVERITQTEGPLDTVAALRVARTWRQLVPIMEMQERAAPSESAEPPATPPTLVQRIAAQGHETPAVPARNGHTASAT